AAAAGAVARVLAGWQAPCRRGGEEDRSGCGHRVGCRNPQTALAEEGGNGVLVGDIRTRWQVARGRGWTCDRPALRCGDGSRTRRGRSAPSRGPRRGSHSRYRLTRDRQRWDYPPVGFEDREGREGTQGRPPGGSQFAGHIPEWKVARLYRPG